MSEVDKAQLMRYIDLEKQIQQYEATNVLKNYEVRREAAEKTATKIKETEIELNQLSVQTKKEKDDVDKMMNALTIGDILETEDFNKQLTKEKEEYLEARNKEEVKRQEYADLQLQLRDLEAEAKILQDDADKLKKLYEERDGLLSDIFGGEYGSVKENQLEAKFDELMDKKQRVSVAHYKWTNARILLQHAVNQLSYAVHKWTELKQIPSHHLKYTCATEVRNNLVAAIQNVNSTHNYLSTIQFPYCRPEEMVNLSKATNNIYTDMASDARHQHAGHCYNVTQQRASALLQWFDMVIKDTIQKDLKKVTEEVKQVEKELRAERIKLIRDKVAESGGDVQGLTEAGLKGLTDQQKLSDEDKDLKGIGIAHAAPVGDERTLPDADNQQRMAAPTPLPLSELAPLPSEDDLFGDISQLKEQHKKNQEELEKQLGLNRIRQEQGLQEKLAARRHKKRT